jgi:hypothetical protein
MNHLNEQLDRSKELMGLILEQYSGGKIQEGDVPCDIWCKIKVAKRGSRGDVVKMIQHLLARGCGDYGPYNPQKMGGGMNEGCVENWTNCDGKFEKETKKAVEEFQGEAGLNLNVDGKVGFNTLSALCKLCYGSATPKDSAEYILCQKQCDCDQQGDGDSIEIVDVVDGDDWFIDIDISPEYGKDCDRIKACLKYAISKGGEHWYHFKECMTKKGVGEKIEGCEARCTQGCPEDPPPGTPVTAVISWCWDGEKCKTLSWGGGPWYSQDECEKCNCKND